MNTNRSRDARPNVGEFFRFLSRVLGVLLLASAVTPAIPASAACRPNIILILTDDQEYGDVDSRNGAGSRKAYVAVKFLDGGYEWNEDRKQATPADFDHQTDTSRILIHAGDVDTHRSFEQFRQHVLSSPLTVTPNNVEYRFGPKATRLAATLFDVGDPAGFTLPTVNGKPVNLRPATTWRSPYLNGKFGSDRVSVTVGPVNHVLDFSEGA